MNKAMEIFKKYNLKPFFHSQVFKGKPLDHYDFDDVDKLPVECLVELWTTFPNLKITVHGFMGDSGYGITFESNM